MAAFIAETEYGETGGVEVAEFVRFGHPGNVPICCNLYVYHDKACIIERLTKMNEGSVP